MEDLQGPYQHSCFFKKRDTLLLRDMEKIKYTTPYNGSWLNKSGGRGEGNMPFKVI